MTPPIEVELSRDGRTSEALQQRIRAALHGNTLALDHIKQFLNYSNTVLRASESRCRTPRDQARAEVSYGKALFLFTRMQPAGYSRENQTNERLIKPTQLFS